MTWRGKEVDSWSNPEVQDFLATVLPGHASAAAFGHTSGKVLATLSKDEIRRQAKDEEAANVIWAELKRQKEAVAEHADITTKGAEPFILLVRLPTEMMLEVEVRPTDTVADVKARIAAMEGTPVERQRLTRNGTPLLDSRSLAACGVARGCVLLLVPRLAQSGHRSFAAPATRGPETTPRPLASGIPRPRVPVVCTDIARPFPMNLEFESISSYQTFMLALQRQVGRRDMASSVAAMAEADQKAPFLEVLSTDNMRPPVQTRITFDPDAEVLMIDSVGDILLDNARYRVLLHLKEEQKFAVLVTGLRPQQ
eukprot:TRINITY_DN64943_c0_g1_i1.p1 TRINITY_DN64943_c0_g1~~TRINITY_DN64943_c0_g1_i1.p1  ORF type:complete len:345 (-),score=64.90 TRINITY_DN64943_c0_g1_i1:81-1013(-)